MYEDRIYPDRKLVVTRFSGVADAAEIKRWIDQIVARPGFTPDFSGVIDFRKAQLDLSIENLDEIAALVAAHQITGRWVQLVSQPAETALVQLYREIARPVHPTAFFSTLRAASGYLNLDLREYLPDDHLF